jgi:hypothetical protein
LVGCPLLLLGALALWPLTHNIPTKINIITPRTPQNRLSIASATPLVFKLSIHYMAWLFLSCS